MRVRSFIQYNCAMELSFGDEIGLENGSKFISQNLCHKVVRHNTGPVSRDAGARVHFPNSRW